MKELFEKYNIILDDEKLKKFEKYYELLVFYNNKFNITAITEKKDVYIKHFIDSLLGKDLLTKGVLIDIGSGGGFPSIPLKIVNDEINMTLLEATGKKCEFLNTVISELDLKNIKVVNDRAEILGKDINYREKFDFCTARAVAKLNTLLEYCLPFIKVNGKFIAYKGNSSEEVNEAKNALNILGGKVNNIYNYKLDDSNRDIIEIVKVKSTDKKYPRGKGRERKNPL